jgi:hypothetical protein
LDEAKHRKWMGVEMTEKRHVELGKMGLKVDPNIGLCVLAAILFLVISSCSRSYEKLKVDMENEPAKQILDAIIKLPPSEERIDSVALSSDNETWFHPFAIKVYNVKADSTEFTLEYTPEIVTGGHTQKAKVWIKEAVTSNSPLESIFVLDLGGDGKPDSVYFNYVVGTSVENSNRWVPYTPGFDYTADDFDRIQKDGNPFVEKWYRDSILKPILNGLQSK